MSKFSEKREEAEVVTVKQDPHWIWIAVVLVVVAAGWAAYYFLYYNKNVSTLDSFAQCLTTKGAKMYGAWWCPHCTDQKEMFGFAFQHVNYVECSDPGQRGMNDTCKQAGIKNFPTWEFLGGKREEGVHQLDRLAQKTGCQLP